MTIFFLRENVTNRIEWFYKYVYDGLTDIRYAFRMYMSTGVCQIKVMKHLKDRLNAFKRKSHVPVFAL